MAGPLVSVILPVFNGSRHIDLALSSIRDQDYKNLDIVVLDDGSTDNTPEILERHAVDQRVRIISRPNRGLISTLNEGLALARGDLIARMDADDIAYPQRLSTQVRAFQDRPGLAICGSRFDLIERGRLWRWPQKSGADSVSLRVLSMFLTIFSHPTVMFDRRILGAHLRYDPDYPFAEDFELFSRAGESLPLCYLPETLLAYRLNEDGITERNRWEMQNTHLRIVSRNLERDGMQGDAQAFARIGPHWDEPSLMQSIEPIHALLRHAENQPEALRPSYLTGVSSLLQMISSGLLHRGRTRLLTKFLDMTDGWRAIRRRERPVLRALAGMPKLAFMLIRGSNDFQRFIDRPRTWPVAKWRAAAALTSIG